MILDVKHFESKFTRGKRSECWLWKGALSKGYGQFWAGEESRPGVRAHRAAWMIYRGPIPSNTFVLHHCDVRSCVNPSHLFMGSHNDNVQDKCKKHRQARGREHGSAKLTDKQVGAIYCAPKKYSHLFLAWLYAVNRTTISRIRRGKMWGHLTCKIAKGGE